MAWPEIILRLRVVGPRRQDYLLNPYIARSDSRQGGLECHLPGT
jgi:hypothetical protein